MTEKKVPVERIKKVRIKASIDEDLAQWIDKLIEKRVFANLSHAVNYMVFSQLCGYWRPIYECTLNDEDDGQFIHDTRERREKIGRG